MSLVNPFSNFFSLTCSLLFGFFYSLFFLCCRPLTLLSLSYFSYCIKFPALLLCPSSRFTFTLTLPIPSLLYPFAHPHNLSHSTFSRSTLSLYSLTLYSLILYSFSDSFFHLLIRRSLTLPTLSLTLSLPLTFGTFYHLLGHLICQIKLLLVLFFFLFVTSLFPQPPSPRSTSLDVCRPAEYHNLISTSPDFT